MPEASHFQYNVTVGYIRVVVDANLDVPAFWAHPQVGGPFPGLILLHDDWGLGEHMRSLSYRFAQMGYYVLAPDLFDGNYATQQLQADALELRYKELASAKVGASIKALETHHKCNAKIAVIGWDLGADVAMQFTIEQPDIMAAVAFYGDASQFGDRLAAINCPLLTILGDQDPITQRTLEAVRQHLDPTAKIHDTLLYPNAPHGFYNDTRPTYAPPAAEDAWAKVLSFLRQYQGTPPPPEDAAPGFFRPGRVY